MQCTSVRLLLNLVEVIFVRRADVLTANDYRVQLARILDAFICKLSVMKEHIPKLLAASASCAISFSKPRISTSGHHVPQYYS